MEALHVIKIICLNFLKLSLPNIHLQTETWQNVTLYSLLTWQTITRWAISEDYTYRFGLEIQHARSKLTALTLPNLKLGITLLLRDQSCIPYVQIHNEHAVMGGECKSHVKWERGSRPCYAKSPSMPRPWGLERALCCCSLVPQPWEWLGVIFVGQQQRKKVISNTPQKHISNLR